MRRRLLRWIAPLALVAALVGGVFAFSRVTIDPELEAKNASLHEELARVEARNATLEGRITELKAEIKRLRSDDAESLFHARTQLGMVRAGEVVYQLAVDAPPVERRGERRR